MASNYGNVPYPKTSRKAFGEANQENKKVMPSWPWIDPCFCCSDKDWLPTRRKPWPPRPLPNSTMPGQVTSAISIHTAATTSSRLQLMQQFLILGFGNSIYKHIQYLYNIPVSKSRAPSFIRFNGFQDATISSPFPTMSHNHLTILPSLHFRPASSALWCLPSNRTAARRSASPPTSSAP